MRLTECIMLYHALYVGLAKTTDSICADETCVSMEE